MSRDVLRNIKVAFDWELYLNTHYTPKRVHGKNGEEFRVCCPSCGDTKYKCYINPSRNAFYCFKCPFRTGRKYDVFDFVALTEGLSKGVATLRLLREYKPVTPEGDITDLLVDTVDEDYELEEIPTTTTKFISGLPEGCYKLKPEDGNPFWEYVKGRGFTERDLLATNLHYVPAARRPLYNEEGHYKGNLGGRILFPIYGQGGKLVSWLSRTITPEDTSVKYLNCPDSDLSHTLWPYSKPYSDTAVIVEGIIDALSVRRVAKTSAYAAFGKKLSREQVALLKSWGIKSVIVWFDKKDAKNEILNVVDMLKLSFQHTYVLSLDDWPPDKDTGYYLSVSDGPAIIENALSKRIDTDNSLDYAKWQMTF